MKDKIQTKELNRGGGKNTFKVILILKNYIQFFTNFILVSKLQRAYKRT
jgi:hypothetical protein